MIEPFLEWFDENQIKQSIKVIDKIFIGRTCKGIDRNKCVIVSHFDVSRDHAEISLINYKLFLIDRSKNGTWVNEVRVKPGNAINLKHGDKIYIGNISFTVTYADDFVREKNSYLSNTYTSPPTIIKREKKITTHLVADIRGFTRMAQKLPVEELYDFIQEIFDRLSAIVNDHKGTIKDYSGDAIFAFWEHGSDYSKEIAMLACQTAIKQMKEIKQLESKLPEADGVPKKLQLGWGISTGQSIMSHYGSITSDIALMGDKVNFAFRLSSLANKDFRKDILLCTDTACLVRDKLAIEELGLVTIHGYSNQELVYAIEKDVYRTV